MTTELGRTPLLLLGGSCCVSHQGRLCKTSSTRSALRLCSGLLRSDTESHKRLRARDWIAMSDDLFGAALQDRLREQAPLAARMRPETLDEVVGQERMLEQGQPLRCVMEDDRLASSILWGQPGTR